VGWAVAVAVARGSAVGVGDAVDWPQLASSKAKASAASSILGFTVLPLREINIDCTEKSHLTAEHGENAEKTCNTIQNSDEIPCKPEQT